jgi:hypothetical protein
MRRLKKVAAIVSLAMVMSTGANVARAGTVEAPGHSIRITAETSDASITGVIESPGFDELILFTMMLMM